MKKSDDILDSALFLAPSSIAKLTGVSVWTIRRAIEEGLISALRTPGGHYRVDKKEFYRYRTARMGIVI